MVSRGDGTCINTACSGRDSAVFQDPSGLNDEVSGACDESGGAEGRPEEVASPVTTLSHRLRNRLPFVRQKTKSASGSLASEGCSSCKTDFAGKKKSTSRGWTFKLCARSDSSLSIDSLQTPAAASSVNTGSCVCTGYRRTDDSVPLTEFPVEESQSSSSSSASSSLSSPTTRSDFATNPQQPPHAAEQVAGEQGRSLDVDLSLARRPPSPPVPFAAAADHINYPIRSDRTAGRVLQNSPADSRSGAPHHASVQVRVSELAIALRNQLASPYPYVARWGDGNAAASGLVPSLPAAGEVVSPSLFSRLCARIGNENFAALVPDGSSPPHAHSQIDFIHRLVPDMLQITHCSFYWGKMDRYEAEKLLENRPEGTFLLRDSAQEEHLFSVSFRRFDRSLHARIEQWNDRFSFDSHDPGVFSSDTVCGLIEHYKDPSHCMFFEPMLTIPLHRNFPFSLQHLCRAIICSRLHYDSINQLVLPKRIRSFLKEYHYKQPVRARTIEP